MSPSPRRTAGWILLVRAMATGGTVTSLANSTADGTVNAFDDDASANGITTAFDDDTFANGTANSTASAFDDNDTFALFTRIFDIECLARTDETALSEAFEYFSAHIKDLRLDAICSGALYFMGLVIAMEMGEVPNPFGTNCWSFCMFWVWFVLQILVLLTQTWSILMIILAYLSMKEHFGDCMAMWDHRVSVLDLLTCLTGLWMPAVLQKMVAIEISLLTSTQGLRAVGMHKMHKFMAYGVKLPFDAFVTGCASLSLAAWFLTAAFVFAVPLLGIPIVMVLFTGAELLFVFALMSGIEGCYLMMYERCKDCYRRSGFHNFSSEPEALEVEAEDYASAVGWIQRGYKVPKNLAELKSTLALSRTAVPRFSYLALFLMAIAPGIVVSTWWAWQAFNRYSGANSDADMVTMLREVYQFSLFSWVSTFAWPSCLDLDELKASLEPENFLEMIEELDAFAYTIPDALLRRSRLLSLLSAELAAVKSATIVLQKCLERTCILKRCQVKTVKVSNGASAREMREMGYPALYVRLAGKSAVECKGAGFSAAECKDAGFSVEECKGAGFSVTECGFSAAECKDAGFSAAECKDAGFSVEGCKGAGFSVTECGFSAAECKDAGFSAAECKDVGFSAAECKEAGFNVKKCKEAGFNVFDCKAAGFSAAEFVGAGFSAAEFKGAGFSAFDCKVAGFSAAACNDAGFSAAECKGAGFSVDECHDAGFSVAECVDAGFPVATASDQLADAL